MRKLFFLVSILSSLYSTAQNDVRANRIIADQDLLPPVLDTVFAPARIGDLRTRPQDGYLYTAISMTPGTNRWAKIPRFSDITVGGGVADGNFNNIQINRNGIFKSPGSDSLTFNGGISVKGTAKFTSIPFVAGTGDTVVTHNETTGALERRLVAASGLGVLDTIPVTDIVVAQDGSGNTYKNYVERVYYLPNYGVNGLGLVNFSAIIDSVMNLARNEGGGRVVCPPGIILVDSIMVPFQAYNVSAPLTSVTLEGYSPPNGYSDPLNSTPNRAFPTSGTVLQSTRTDAGAVVKSAGSSTSWEDMNHIGFYIKNMTIRLKSRNGSGINIGAKGKGIDANNMAYLDVDNVRFDTQGPADSLLLPEGTSAGIITPKSGNFIHVRVRNSIFTGLDSGIVAHEHFKGEGNFFDVCKRAYVFPGTDHAIFIDNDVIARCVYTFTFYGSSTQSVFAKVSVERNPSPGKWYDFGADIDEQTPGQAQGEIHIHAVHGDARIVKTNPNGSRIKTISSFGNMEYRTTAALPLNVDSFHTVGNRTTGHLNFYDGAAWKEIVHNAQTRNFWTVGGKLGVNGDPTASTYWLNVYDAAGAAGNMLNLESASALIIARMNSLTANGIAGWAFEKSAIRKWTVLNELLGNNTNKLSVYNNMTSESNQHFDADGTVNLGGNTLVAPMLKLDYSTGHSIFANTVRINTVDAGSSYKFQLGGNAWIFGNMYMVASGTNARLVDWGASYGTPYGYYYNGGASSRIGSGINGGEHQHFLSAGSREIWNGGGDFEVTATHRRMTLTEAGTWSLGGSDEFIINTSQKISKYAGTAPTNGKLLIGHTSNGTLELGNIVSADASVIITNNAASIDLSVPSVITESTYEASATNTTNIAGSTTYTTRFIRIGDWVYVWGEIDIDATAALTISELGLSLPTTTDITQTRDLSGNASFEDNTVIEIKGDVTNNRAMFRFTPQSATNNKYSFHFSYKHFTP